MVKVIKAEIKVDDVLVVDKDAGVPSAAAQLSNKTSLCQSMCRSEEDRTDISLLAVKSISQQADQIKLKPDNCFMNKSSKQANCDDKKAISLVRNGMQMLDNASTSYEQIDGHSEKWSSVEPLDFAAQFIDSTLKKPETATFTEHVKSLPRKVLKRTYIFNSNANEHIVHLGTEDECRSFGYDYAMAAIDPYTGRATFTPTRLVRMEAKRVLDRALMLGDKLPPKVEYKKDFTEDYDWVEQRRSLTTSFGSAKRNKLLDAAKNRSIEEASLITMISSALKPEDEKNKVALDKVAPEISQLKKETESSVLPKANMSAQTAKDVYSWNIFCDEKEVIELGPIALEALKLPLKQLLDKGYPAVALRLIGNLLSRDQTIQFQRAVAIVLLSTMHFIYTAFKPRKSAIELSHLANAPMPTQFVNKVRTDYMSDSDNVEVVQRFKGAAVLVNNRTRDRLVSHMLLLGLLLGDNFTLPVTPWKDALRLTDDMFCKLTKALGCVQQTVSGEDSRRLQTVRTAVLNGPPIPGRTKRKNTSSVNYKKS